MSTRLFRILSALSSIVGVILLNVSFSYPGPPLNPTSAQMAAFARQHFTSTLSGAWLQAIGPLLILIFAFAVVCQAGAATRLAGWLIHAVQHLYFVIAGPALFIPLGIVIVSSRVLPRVY